MPYKTPKDIARAGIDTGSTKARLSWDKALVAGFLAGAYIAIAGLLAIVVSAGMPKAWGGLVCLGVWMALAADDIAGKILAIFFPVMAFVALGFDHVVANMFFLPAAIFAHVPGIGWGDALHNWVFAFLGNAGGATIFVAASYWFLYARQVHEEPGDTPSGAAERSRVPAEAVR